MDDTDTDMLISISIFISLLPILSRLPLLLSHMAFMTILFDVLFLTFSFHLEKQ